MARKQSLVLKSTFTPTVENIGEMLQNLRIKMEGHNKNGTKVVITGEIDIWQAGQLVNEIRKAVKKFKDCADETVNQFDNKLKN